MHIILAVVIFLFELIDCAVYELFPRRNFFRLTAKDKLQRKISREYDYIFFKSSSVVDSARRFLKIQKKEKKLKKIEKRKINKILKEAKWVI